MSCASAVSTRPVLLAYLHLRPGTPEATTHVLQEYVTAYAERAGYAPGEVFVAVEDRGELRTLLDLLAAIEVSGADTVLVSGSGHAVMAALRHLTRVHVVTLAEVASERRRAR